MPDQPPGDRAVILACSVRSLRKYVLDAQRGCGRTVHFPLMLMAQHRQLAGLTMADVVAQLRCQQCGERPASVALLEHGAAGIPGMMGDRTKDGAAGWVVTLVGD